MQGVLWMSERYTPLKTKIIDALWSYGGPLLDFVGTNFAAPVLKSYGKRFIWPDLRDFVVIPYFKSDYVGCDPKDFSLQFPQRSVIHWITALLVNLILLISPKLLWDTARFVEWVANFSVTRQQSRLTSWFSWMMFRGAIWLFISGSFFVAVAGFLIIAALLWWSAWYLALGQSGVPRRHLGGISVIGIILAFAFSSYGWWVTHTPPLWNFKSV